MGAIYEYDPTEGQLIPLGGGGGSGSGGHQIQDEGTAMAQEDALNFIDHDLTDDSANGATKVAPHRLTSSELSDICKPLPDAPTLVGNMRMSLLWTNSDPSSAFAAQEVTIDDNYDLYVCIANYSTSVATETSAIFAKGHYFQLRFSFESSNKLANAVRNVSYVSDGKYSFGGGKVLLPTSSATDNNNMIIPLYIYGIKLI